LEGARKFPLTLELIESDRLISESSTFGAIGTTPAEGNEIRRGIEINGNGETVAFHLWDRHPNDLATGINGTGSSRVDADRMLHLYQCDRVGQTRGVSWLATVVMWLRDLGVYLENELMASSITSCLTAVIKTVDSGDSFGGLAGDSGEDDTDTRGNTFERFEPGLVAHLMPGEDIEVINPARSQSEAAVWINLILRSIAVGANISFELLSRDYSQTNFSSNRASQLEDRRAFRPIQKAMVWDFCQPIYERWFEHNVLAGVAGFPNAATFFAQPERWLAVQWHTPGWEWVDPARS
jgi:lambda family phage portal protein